MELQNGGGITNKKWNINISIGFLTSTNIEENKSSRKIPLKLEISKQSTKKTVKILAKVKSKKELKLPDLTGNTSKGLTGAKSSINFYKSKKDKINETYVTRVQSYLDNRQKLLTKKKFEFRHADSNVTKNLTKEYMEERMTKIKE